MATVAWTGNAQAIAQVTSWLFANTWVSTETVTATINGTAIVVTTGSTVITTIIDNIVTALNASTLTEFAAITWSRSTNDLVGTADVAGVPFTCTVSTNSAAGTIDTLPSSTGVNDTACTGPNFGTNTGNWSGGAVPGNGDTVIFANSSVSCLYGLSAMSAVTLAVLDIQASYTGDIGLPRYESTAAGSTPILTPNAEYRGRYLEVGATLCYIGFGEGSGSDRINLNFGSVQTSVTVDKTASVATGSYAVQLLGTNASNQVVVNRGSVGIAADPGEVSTFATIVIGHKTVQATDSNVFCGSGCTLTNIDQTGGTAYVQDNVTTIDITGGTLTVAGAATCTTANIDGGTIYYNSTGTLTTVNAGDGGSIIFNHSTAGRTVTNVNLYKGSTWTDPFGTVTATNGYDFHRCTPADVTFNVVPHRTWTPTSI